MIRTMLIVVVTFLTTISLAQNVHKPSKLVAQKKSSGNTFQSVQLFSITQNKNNFKEPKGLKDYTLLEVNHGKMRAMKNSFPETLNLTIPGQKTPLSLDLVKVSIKTDDHSATDMPSKKVLDNSESAHYRGIVKGNPKSLVAISFYEGKVSGLISIDGAHGNLVIGPLSGSKKHILYKDEELSYLYEYSCKMKEEIAKGYTFDEVSKDPTKVSRAAGKCVRVFIDICTDVVNNKGGAGPATNYIEALFNQVSVLYANDDISVKLSGTKAWTSNQPFNNNNLDSYISYRNRNGLNGDVGHMVNYSYQGGLAGGIGTLCNSSRNYAVDGIQGSFQNVPTYSFDVFLISHELGHNVGSRHTHACVWNGNNTAIDGCAGRTEGGCSLPGNPSGGGTIMSYCPNTSVGVNFNLGFGPQPRNVIRNYIANSSCLGTCDGGGGGDCGPGDAVSVTFTNNTDCTLEYSVSNSVQVTLSAGNSTTRNTTVGTQWTVKTTSGQTKDNFTISCDTTTYSSSGSCSNGGGGSCDGVPQYNSNVYYYPGDRVVYNGYLYELTYNNGWVNLGPCSQPADPCEGVAPYSPYVTYYPGDFVVYNGYLYELTYYDGWVNRGACGGRFESFSSLKIPKEFSFSVYPVPTKDVITVEIANIKSNVSNMVVTDINGRRLETIELKKTPDNSVKQPINVGKYSKGVYFIELVLDDRKVTRKIIIE
ncbi:zinc-dependent metalloprotease [Tenacibaculum xiamenense]|uniref:zinc-dependent metalloprotease n=1 Tax=Tenacibaculum xiamenense TaxID=1261553 RepID=UPI003895EC48